MAAFTLPRRNFVALAAAAAIPTTVLAAPSMVAERDPIFGLIDAHRVARRRRIEALRAGDDEVADELADENLEAQVAMLTTPPRTLPGCAALLRYVSELGEAECAAFTYSDWCDDAAEAGQTFLPMIADALLRYDANLQDEDV